MARAKNASPVNVCAELARVWEMADELATHLEVENDGFGIPMANAQTARAIENEILEILNKLKSQNV